MIQTETPRAPRVFEVFRQEKDGDPMTHAGNISGKPDVTLAAASLGAAGALRKPFGAEDLLGAVRRCC